MFLRSLTAIALLMSVAFFAPQAHAQNKPPIKVNIGVGFGWHVCPKTDKLPPLGEAFICSGMTAGLENVELELINKPAAKPEWLYYEAPYTLKTDFQDIKSTVELLVMYAEFDGHKMGFIDGRIISEKNGKSTEPVYFRASAEGGLQNLKYSSAYGTTVVVPSTGGGYAPYVAIDAMAR